MIARAETNSTTVTIDPRRYSSNIEFARWMFITDVPNGEYEGQSLAELPAHVPWLVPVEQAYYWTKEWQAGEREAQAAIDACDLATFDSNDPDDVVRWLESGDEGRNP